MVSKVTREFKIELDGEWSGLVVMKMLNYRDRITLAQDYMGAKDGDISVATGFVDLCREHVVSIDATYKGEYPFNCLDDLEFSREGSTLINQLASMVLNGPPLGNVLKVLSNESVEPQPKDDQ